MRNPLGRNQWKPVPWTRAEDHIVRNNSVADAVAMLPGRTNSMVRHRREKIGHSSPLLRWTAREDGMLRKYGHEPIRKLARRFKRRTAQAVSARRNYIGAHPKPKIFWTVADERKLERHWDTATMPALLAMFPRRSYSAICQRARKLGLSRQTKQLPDEEADLRAQIRERLAEDQIAIRRFGREIGCGAYFSGPKARRIHIAKIAKAVEFFGGRLVIDWQDE